MNDPSGVAIVDSIAKLKEEEFELIGCHGGFMFAEVFL